MDFLLLLFAIVCFAICYKKLKPKKKIKLFHYDEGRRKLDDLKYKTINKVVIDLYRGFNYIYRKLDNTEENTKKLKVFSCKIIYLCIVGQPLFEYKEKQLSEEEISLVKNNWILEPTIAPALFNIITDSGTNLDKDYYCKINNDFIKDKFTFQLPITPEESWVYVENYAVEYNKKYK